MPLKRTSAKRRGELGTIQRWNLVLGHMDHQPVESQFATEKERRAAWECHRDKLLAKSGAGKRPQAWWDYEASESRDEKMAECLQLRRMGELSRAELDALIPLWREWEEKARTIDHYCAGPGEFLSGRAAYLAWRKWAGIPDDLFPPAGDLTMIFKLENKDAGEKADAETAQSPYHT